MSVGLAFKDWPELDRQSWQIANADGDLLTGRGPAAGWKSKTRLTARKAYGNYLRFLRDSGRLKAVASVGERLMKENLRDYIMVLRERVCLTTVVTQLSHLSAAIAAMDPAADRGLIKLAISRLNAIVNSSRDKEAKLVSPVVLFDLGLKLMAGWQARDAHDPRLNAMDYRDGLMIAFLALCPIRLANLAQMEIGVHLTRQEEGFRVCFEAKETKGGKAIDVGFPEELLDALHFYLESIHPMLARQSTAKTALWPSLHNRPLSEHGIYTMITAVTETKLGRHITPHMFRHAAATLIAELTPERALMAAAVLQHRSFATTRRHYIHGQQHGASRRYQTAIEELIQDATETTA